MKIELEFDRETMDWIKKELKEQGWIIPKSKKDWEYTVLEIIENWINW